MDDIGLKTLSLEKALEVHNDWNYCEDVCFHYRNIASIDPPVQNEPQLDKYAGGFNGRLIAKYTTPFGLFKSSKKVEIYDSQFKSIGSVLLDSNSDDVFIYVDKNDSVLALNNLGKLNTYRHLTLISSIEIGQPRPIIAASFWDGGFVFMDDSKSIYSFRMPSKLELIGNAIDFGKPSIFTCVPPSYSASGTPIVLASDSTPRLFIISSDTNFNLSLPSAPTLLSISPEYEYIAMILDPTTFIIASIALDETYASFKLDGDEIPVNLAWLGSETPVVGYDGKVNIVVRTQETETQYITGKPLLFSLGHGTLIITGDSVLYLQSVQDELKSTFGALPKPASKLLSATLKRDFGAILEISDSLNQAVSDLVASSLQLPYDPERQKVCILSATLGKTYLQQYDSQSLAEAVRILRVRNSMEKELNVLIEASDLKASIEDGSLFLRICNREKHSLALEIAKYLKAERKPIVGDWCQCLLREVKKDEDVIRLIQRRMEEEDIDLASVAVYARSLKRDKLALDLARMCPIPSMAIPFFIDAKMWDNAVDAAVRAGDTQMFVEVLKSCDASIVSEVLQKERFAFGAAIKFAKDGSDIYSTIQRSVNPANIDLLIRSGADVSKISMIEKSSILVTAKGLGEEAVRLNEFKEKVKSKGKVCMGETKNQILENLIMNEDPEGIIGLLDKNFCSEKRFRLMVGYVLAKKKRWSALGRIAANGNYKNYWETFLVLCFVYGGPDTAKEFVSHIGDQGAKATLEQNLGKSGYPEEVYGTQICSYSAFPRGLFK